MGDPFRASALGLALALGLAEVPCEVRASLLGSGPPAPILEYNRQRRKSFSQLMREADALEDLLIEEPGSRRLANLRAGRITRRRKSPGATAAERRNSDGRDEGRGERGRSASRTQRSLGAAPTRRSPSGSAWGEGPVPPGPGHLADGPRGATARAVAGVAQLDAGTKTIHAAYKDLRRRDRFTAGFRPTPYDVWAFRHDRAFGIPHPGSIPPGDRRPRPPLLHRPRRPGRRPDGRRRHHARRLPVDGTPLPCVRPRPGPPGNPHATT